MGDRSMTDMTTFAEPCVRYGRPTFDFAAAPSLFVAEDLRQEDFALAHRNNVNSVLAQSEVFEAEAVAARRNKEKEASAAAHDERAAARYAAETREIELAAQAAAAQAEEYRQMLASAAAEQQRAQAEHAKAACASEEAAANARDCEFNAVQARLANDNCFAERHVLEGQGSRGPVIASALGARTPYYMDKMNAGPSGGAVQCRQRSSRFY